MSVGKVITDAAIEIAAKAAIAVADAAIAHAFPDDRAAQARALDVAAERLKFRARSRAQMAARKAKKR